jgi:hypothetical protein
MRNVTQINEEQNKGLLKTELKALYVEFDKERLPTKKQELKRIIKFYEDRIVELTRREKISG